MARELLAGEPAFAAAIDRCDAALPAGLGWTVRQQLTSEPGTPTARIHEIAVLQPTLLAVEIALAELWRSWGIEPEAVVGHSMGEVGAAHIGGAITLDEAMTVICARSALMQRTSGAGAMALLELGVVEARTRIGPYGDRVCVAVDNGPRSTVVSGDPDVIAEVLAGCARDDVFARAVQVDVASHSPQMDPLVPELVAAVAAVGPQSSAIDIYSTVDGQLRPGGLWDAGYWGRNLRQTVRFWPAVQQMLAAGIDTVIEVGPHPALLAGLAQATAGGGAPLLLASLRRAEPERAALLATLGALWTAGHPVAWSQLFPSDTYTVVALPLYPWQRQRHWSNAALPALPTGTGARRVVPEEAQGWLHALRWEPAPTPDPDATARRWVLVGGAPELDALGRILGQRSHDVIIVASVADAVEAADRLTAGSVETGIVIATEPDESAFAVVHAVQALAAVAPAARLWWVTRGAHAVAGEEPSAHAAEQGAVWGAARVVAAEHPDRWGGVVDLDPGVAFADQADALADHLCAERTEDQVAIRDGLRYGLRLVAADPPPASAPAWRTDAAYLVTGGFGGVAQRIATSMVADGARRLVLLSRTALPPRDQWSSLPPGSNLALRTRFVRDLEHAGASVHVLVADVADETQVRAALDAYAAEGWPAIAGVIHTAAVLENHLTGTLDQAAFDRVSGPKLGGALILDRLLPELDLFVVFSSCIAFWTQSGTASYTAANTGLDSLAQARRARGQHALSIQWAPWAEVGLHERTDVARSAGDLAEEGLGSLPAEHATAVFAGVLATREPVIAVIPVDWNAFRRARRGRETALFRDVVGADDAAAADGVALQLVTASAVERRSLLDRVVRTAAGRVLRISPAQLDAQRPLGSMGLDSLMALELRRRLEAALERPLSATLAWNYPTVAALVAHLDSLLAGADVTPVADWVPADALASEDDATDLAQLLGDLSTDLSTMSDDDAARALRGGR